LVLESVDRISITGKSRQKTQSIVGKNKKTENAPMNNLDARSDRTFKMKALQNTFVFRF
jgi:hypothetical protein